MNIHEYQAKEVLAKHGVAVPKGVVVDNPEKAEAAAREAARDADAQLAAEQERLEAEFGHPSGQAPVVLAISLVPGAAAGGSGPTQEPTCVQDVEGDAPKNEPTGENVERRKGLRKEEERQCHGQHFARGRGGDAHQGAKQFQHHQEQ